MLFILAFPKEIIKKIKYLCVEKKDIYIHNFKKKLCMYITKKKSDN